MTVMLVDDHKEFRDVLRGFLEERHHVGVVAEASNGIEAIRQAASVKPDLILMDISMPVMDGLSAAREIKRSLPDIAVVFVSFYDEVSYKDSARKAGGDGFVSKATLVEDLPAVLETLRERLETAGSIPASKEFIEASRRGTPRGASAGNV